MLHSRWVHKVNIVRGGGGQPPLAAAAYVDCQCDESLQFLCSAWWWDCDIMYLMRVCLKPKFGTKTQFHWNVSQLHRGWILLLIALCIELVEAFICVWSYLENLKLNFINLKKLFCFKIWTALTLMVGAIKEGSLGGANGVSKKFVLAATGQYC